MTIINLYEQLKLIIAKNLIKRAQKTAISRDF